MSFQAQMSFSQKFMPTVKKIIKKLSVRFMKIDDATFFDDINGTDLIINYPGKVECSVRIRQLKYMPAQDVTIRYKSRKGNFSADLTKMARYYHEGIKKPWWYFYGYGDEQNFQIPNFVLIDMIKLLNPSNNDILDKVRNIHENKDGSNFMAFLFEELRKRDCTIVEFKNGYIHDTLDKYLKKLMEN